ncbi:MAG: CRISPR-associated helicase Cas3' [Pseudomonadota bacterium]
MSAAPEQPSWLKHPCWEGLYAHSLPDSPLSDWEPLPRHLHEVGSLAAGFASRFGAGDLALILGLLHDLGKAKPGFQSYIQGQRGSDPHAAEGALAATRVLTLTSGPDALREALGKLLAYAIAGHHSGLANGSSNEGRLTPLKDRLEQAADLTDLARQLPLPALSRSSLPIPPTAFGLAFLVRMLLSCLVDADRLATEAFYSRATGQETERTPWRGSLPQLRAALNRHMALFAGGSGTVNALRAEVLAACRASAAEAPGLFSLTVPTGGGKTLSSLAFALEHAIRHDLERVIYVIPYTSIIEQTAAVFCQALGDKDAILEHHSAFDWDAATDDDEGRDGLRKLQRAAENWDRPIVVTTAVQFFESLFANRPTPCRKLHRLAKAVIVLDEAQSLPLPLLRPCLAAISELATNYGSSLVLCTATQPAVTAAEGFKAPEALKGVREIAPDPQRLYRSLKRVRVADLGALCDTALLERLAEEPRVLCIVNNRRHARLLYQALRDKGVAGARLLTTAITPADRAGAVAEIKEALHQKRPLRLVSTSLIEAGVDLDFPVVYRALAGIESLAQAAGRCNREGKLDHGRVFVFRPEETEGAAPQVLRRFAQVAEAVLGQHDDPLSLEAVRAYFDQLYWQYSPKGLDAEELPDGRVGILAALEAGKDHLDFPFESVAQAFQMIKQTQRPVIIPALAEPRNATETLLESVTHRIGAGSIARDLQRFSVQIPQKARTALLQQGAATCLQPERFGDQFVLLTNHDLYRADSGLSWEDPSYRDEEGMIL